MGMKTYQPFVHPEVRKVKNYYNRGRNHVIQKVRLLTFALVGNQNCGKRTLFNQLTDANQNLGNFPGVTVNRKDMVSLSRNNKHRLVRDLSPIPIYR